MKFILRLNKKIYFLSAIIFLMILLPAFSKQDQVSVPVEFSIEPYYEVILTSVAVEIDEKGNEKGNKTIEKGSLLFGTINSAKLSDVLSDNSKEIFFSSDYKTVTRIQIINNTKPFILEVEIVLQDPSKKSILTIKQNSDENSSALQLMTKTNTETIFPGNLESPGIWRSFNDSSLVIYDSQGMVVSDVFEVEFALRDVSAKTLAETYSGKIIWTIKSVL